MNDLIKYFNLLLYLLEIEEQEIQLVIKKNNIYYNQNLDIIEFEQIDNVGKALANFENDEYTDLTVFIDLDQHKNLEEYTTLTHELRHIYQMLAINETDYEPLEVTNKWQSDFNNYKQASNDKHKLQDVELDANAFTSIVVQKIFKLQSKIELINDDFNYWYEKVINDFNDIDYLEALEYSKFDNRKIREKIIKFHTKKHLN